MLDWEGLSLGGGELVGWQGAFKEVPGTKETMTCVSGTSVDFTMVRRRS